MSTSTTHQQSLADVGSETRHLMLERGSYIPWASHFRRRSTCVIYNRFAQLMNDLERNDITFPLVTVNIKFLNYLQPEWLKYVTLVRLAKILTEDTYDDLFDYLQQFEKLVNASRTKKLEKSHDPLALVAYTSSSSKTTSPYYVTHSSSVVDYDDDYQGDAFQNNYEDPLISAMMLLARAITQRFSNPTNNHLQSSSGQANESNPDDDELPAEKVSQELVKELSQTVDEAKLHKVVNEMLRQRCTSGDEHQYHIDQMQNFLKNDIIWESRKEILVLPLLQKPTPVV
ncbi:hypothetical protein Tco_0000056 [Tanacetum coccineum]